MAATSWVPPPLQAAALSPSSSDDDGMDYIDHSSDKLDDFFGDFSTAMLTFDPDADMPLQEYPRDAPVIFPLTLPTQNQPKYQLDTCVANLPSTTQGQTTALSSFAHVVSREATDALLTVPAKKKRHQIARACQVCRNAKAKCTETRPCPRCVRLNIAGCEPTPAKSKKGKSLAVAKSGFHFGPFMLSQPPFHRVSGVFA